MLVHIDNDLILHGRDIGGRWRIITVDASPGVQVEVAKIQPNHMLR
jgi:hypothetical protein